MRRRKEGAAHPKRRKAPQLKAAAPGARREAVVVPAALDGERVDRVVPALVATLSRTRTRKIIGLGGLYLGMERCRVASRPVLEGDLLTITWHEAVLEVRRFPLEILYEDDRVVAVAKPSGQHVQGTELGDTGTLIRELERRFGPEVRLLHRIDAPASGVLLAARDAFAVTALSKQFREHTIERSYQAITAGAPPEGSCELPLAREGRRMRVAAADEPGALSARTDLEIIEPPSEDSGRARIRARLHTGRTHQVRVHLSALGAPIVGDRLYGGPPSERLALHAERLLFLHPSDRREVEILCEPPMDLPAR